MPGFMNCLRLASTSPADGPEYFCGLWLVCGNGISFINASKFRCEFAQHKINHESERKSDEPGVVEQIDEAGGNTRGIKLIHFHQKARQAWQHTDDKSDNGNITESISEPILADGLIQSGYIELAMAIYKI